MEAVTGFLEAWARHVAPACDPAVVRGVFETASAGSGAARGRDGRRASVITPWGLPFEASTTGNGSARGVLRYLTEAGADQPFFRPRLEAQREALDRLVHRLPGDLDHSAVAAELRGLVDALFPDPSGVPARTRHALFFGIVHDPAVPNHLGRLKLYGSLRWRPDVLGTLATRWPAFAALAGAVEGIAGLVPHMACIEVDAAGRWRHKLYFVPATAGDRPLGALAERTGVDARRWSETLSAQGVAVQRWDRTHICCEANDGAGWTLAVHITAKALGLAPSTMSAVARHLAERRYGDTSALDALATAVVEGAPASVGPWHCTVIGFGLDEGGRDDGPGKVNLYVAPTGDSA